MDVVAHIRCDPDIVGQRVGLQISIELRERNNVGTARGVVANVVEEITDRHKQRAATERDNFDLIILLNGSGMDLIS